MNHQDGTFTLDKTELRAVMAFASTDDTRPHLNGVCFDAAKGAIVATDGHTLIRCNGMVPCPSEEPYIVPLATLKQANALLRKQSHLLEVTSALGSNGRTVVVLKARDGAVCLGAVEVELDPEAQDFPPYESAIPSAGFPCCETGAVGFSGTYLARLALVGKAACSRTTGVKLAGLRGELDPALFKVSGPGMSADVVIMPMRI